MPAPPDPRPGSAFIWLISSVLFLSIAAGGGCLVVYMLQPDSSYATWLPFAGVAFVCLPWLFWVVTCFYRLISRAFGFRVGVASGGGGGGGGAYKGGAYAAGGVGAGGGGGPNAANAANNKVAIEAHAGSVEHPLRSSPESEARRRAQFEAILSLDDPDIGHGSSEETTDTKKTSSLSARLTGCNDSSVASHESEIPLASSMAT